MTLPTLSDEINNIIEDFSKKLPGQVSLGQYDHIYDSLTRLIQEVLEQTPIIDVHTGIVDPSAGVGVYGKTGDLYLRNAPGSDGGELWVKVGDLDTNWSIVTTAATSALTSGHIFVGNASNIATDVAMSSEASISSSGAVTIANSAVIGKVITGFSSGSGELLATDSILQAVNKLDGNIEKIGHVTISPDSNVNHDLILVDDGTFIDMTSAIACTITVPLNITVAFPIGATVSIRQGGAGIVTITSVVGVTLQSVGGLSSTSGQYAVASLLKVGTDTWALFGSLA